KEALVAVASRGIGAHTAEAFAAAGYAVVLGACDGDALRRVVEDITDSGGRRRRPRSATSNPRRRSWGWRSIRSDASTASTTPPMPSPIADVDVDGFDRGIRTDVRGTFLGMKAQIPAMLDTGSGTIVNMASVAGVRAMTNLSAYVAAKAAI